MHDKAKPEHPHHGPEQSAESMNTEPEQTARPEKHRRTWKPVEVIVATVAICIITVILWLLTLLGGTPGPTFNFAERFNELSRPAGFTEADNAADLYDSALACFHDMPSELADVGLKKYETRWPGELDDKSHTLLTAWLKSNEKTLTYAHQAAAKRWYWTPLASPDGSPYGDTTRNLTKSLDLARVLNWRAVFSASEGLYAEAFTDLETAWLIALHLSRGTMWFEQNISAKMQATTCSTALIILDKCEPDSQVLTRFQTFVQDHPMTTLSFRDQELICLWLITKVFTDDGHGDGHLILNEYTALFESRYGSGPPRSLDFSERLQALQQRCRLIAETVNHDGRNATIRKIERLFALLEEISAQTPWQLKSRGTTHEREVERVIGSGQHLLLEQLWGPAGSLIEGAQLTQNTQQALVAILAAMRYRADKGIYPDTLTGLQATGYLATLPQDPYSDGPLVYRKSDDGFILYSVGEDFKDNGGKKHQWLSKDKDTDYIYWPVPVVEVPQQSMYYAPGRTDGSDY